MSGLFELAVKCIDAQLGTTTVMSENSDILSEIEDRLIIFREQYGEPQEDHEFTPEYHAAYDALEYDIMMIAWDHIKTLMLDCGAGEIAGEVFESEAFGKELSWEKKL